MEPVRRSRRWDTAKVWLETEGNGVVICTHSWGPGAGRHFGSDAIETWLHLDGLALWTLVCALIMDDAELDPTAPPIEVLAAAYRGDSAATSHVRRRLEELDLPFPFHLR